MTDINNIRDDEFRVIGKAKGSRRCHCAKWQNWTLLLAVVLILVGIVVFAMSKRAGEGLPDDMAPGLHDDAPEWTAHVGEATPLGHEDEQSYTERLDTVVNDVVLALYIPHHATAELTVGLPDMNDGSIVLAAQAADIRSDNHKILGSFVLKGNLLAKGKSKKGYCAIIDGRLTVGVSETTPLLEEAVEKDGYFFRQYPLVDNGVLVENEPKGKAVRKALCSRAGQIFVVVSETNESFHDFAQALVDLGVDNAIYLVGGHSSFGWFIDLNGEKTLFTTDVHKGIYRNENYIIWK